MLGTASPAHRAPLTASGRPDPSFGSNGVATTPVPGGTSAICGLDLQSDGGIVATGAVGSIDNGTTQQCITLREATR